MSQTSRLGLSVFASLAFTATVVLISCGGGGNAAVLFESSSGTQPLTGENVVLRNAFIHTVNAAQPQAEALAIRNGVIAFVGSDAGVQAFIDDNTVVVDLRGRMVMPGIHDVHMHPIEAGSSITTNCLLEAGRNPENHIPELRACAPNQQGTEVVLGGGFSIEDLLDTFRLPVEIIDDAIPNRPALMLEETSHSTWANSRALADAGISAATPNPAGGVIDKDPTTGEPTGLLIDNAGDILFHRALSPAPGRPDLSELNYQGLLLVLDQMAQFGITSASDARTYWQRDHLDVWRRAERENQLSARIALGLWAYPELDDAQQIPALQALFSENPNSLLQVNQIKFYTDGIIINGTSALLAPYNSTPGFTGNTGLNYFTPARLQQYITALETTGFNMNIHAIGDRGVREALNAIQGAIAANGPRDRRHRITHVEMVDASDIPRFAQLGVIADAQVAGDFTLPGGEQDAVPFIGNRRASRLIPLRELHDANARITLSSDFDVSSLSPFVGMENALSRGNKSLPDIETVIATYTINAAFAMRQDAVVGSIEVGKEADLIVLSQNLLNVPTSQISDTEVLLTLLAGETVFQSPNL